MPPSLIPPYWHTAQEHLTTSDPVMKKLVAAYTGESLTSGGNAFITLANSIVGQQISVKAASAIWGRLEALVEELSAETLCTLSPDQLRACGLSRQKILYLTSLATAFAEGSVQHHLWHDSAIEDSFILKELTKLHGIGRWTAEMFMIFYLLRPDILPLGDVALCRAIEQHYAEGKSLNKEEMTIIATAWQPYRTVATWYLWRSLDPHPVAY